MRTLCICLSSIYESPTLVQYHTLGYQKRGCLRDTLDNARTVHTEDNGKSLNVYAIKSNGVVPDNMSFEQAASFNLGTVTSFVALYRELKLPRPQEHKVFETPEYILIWGGASSAVQLAHLSGLTVVTASPRHHDYLRTLGADYLVDYADPNATAKIREITHGKLRYAYDTVGATTAELAAQALDPRE
ncbi:hypothetical protein BC937DRAFT_90185 [Endogone sp. FLAS-F59071]|nr:hypothetical protein BC937DRAFT_90185 [Endogone sp. FLAS-F59071]|eukprot:RUS23238.1 hypothetical protein BC937DRAFT_90185 [Endogone sp. FLAS-F59071]